MATTPRIDYQKKADETPLFDPSTMKEAPDVPEPATMPERKKPVPPKPPVVKKAKGGVTRADGCAQRGKTKGRMV